MIIGPLFKQYNALTKPRVIQLIVFCALIGMVLAVPGAPTFEEWQRMALASLGIWLVAGAAAAFNCLVEKSIDAKMRRTAWRPTARGELSDLQALGFSVILCALGSVLLYVWINPLTMWLTFATFIGYAVIYTLVLKPMTPQNIVIGGASGAMPPVLGWAAMTGQVGAEAAILFLIIFLWTPPHFGHWHSTELKTIVNRAYPCCLSRTATNSPGCKFFCTPFYWLRLASCHLHLA